MEMNPVECFGVLFIGIMILIGIEDLYMIISDIIAYLKKHYQRIIERRN